MKRLNQEHQTAGMIGVHMCNYYGVEGVGIEILLKEASRGAIAAVDEDARVGGGIDDATWVFVRRSVT